MYKSIIEDVVKQTEALLKVDSNVTIHNTYIYLKFADSSHLPILG